MSGALSWEPVLWDMIQHIACTSYICPQDFLWVRNTAYVITSQRDERASTSCNLPHPIGGLLVYNICLISILSKSVSDGATNKPGLNIERSY